MQIEALKRHYLSVLVQNSPGIFMRISALLNRRGFQTESISAGEAKEKGMVRFTISTWLGKRALDQIQKQLYKIIDVVRVSRIDGNAYIETQLALIKIWLESTNRDRIMQAVTLFDGTVIDAGPDGIIVQITGCTDKVDSFLGLIDNNDVVDIARSGSVAINRWHKKENENGKNLL